MGPFAIFGSSALSAIDKVLRFPNGALRTGVVTALLRSNLGEVLVLVV